MNIARKLAEEYMENFEEREKEAREERKKSVDWSLVKSSCNTKQIEAIKLFIEYRFYEGAASIAEMSILDFVNLLEKLGISRA
ncbi:MAG: hypothetical protein ACFFGZ_16520 [Candidatus Thorarchaeota archaeon]